MPWTVADLAPPLDGDAPNTPTTTSLAAPFGGTTQLIRIPKGARWSTALIGPRATLLILEGCATASADERRESIASGHLLTTDTSLTLDNDGDGPLSALAWTPPNSVQAPDPQ